MKKRHLLSLAVLMSTITVIDARAQCGTCQPQLKPNWPTPHYSVFLDGSLPAAARNAALNGVNMWNSWFTSRGEAPPFTIVNYGPAQIQVYIDPSLHGTGYGAVNTSGQSIGVNPDYANNAQAFLTQVLGHEFGHSVGFNDVDGTSLPGCNGQTIMYGIINPNASSFLAGLTNVDSCALNTAYPPPPPTPPPPPPPSDPPPDPPPTSDQCFNGDCSPIVINFERGGYRLTGADAPVSFDIAASGSPAQIGWTATGADEAFLCLDRNHNGTIDSGAELFGNATRLENGLPAANGFIALAELDGNHDGVIDERDAIWSELLLWRDLNHDGISQPWELQPVATSTVKAISLDDHWTGRRDSSGNTFRYESKIWIDDSNKVVSRPVYDIFFVLAP